MDRNTVLSKLNALAAQVGDSDEDWTSLSYMAFIAEVEDAFDLHFEMKDITPMKSNGELADRIVERKAAGNDRGGVLSNPRQALSYPIDGRLIISKKLKLRKMLLADGSVRVRKRIAILGGVTTDDVKQCIELFLLNYGIEPEFYESEYNQYYQDAVFPPKELLAFKPDIIYICTTNRNITRYPEIAESPEAVSALADAELAKYTAMWDHLAETFHCPVIQNNFDKPPYRLQGNRDATDIHGAVHFTNLLNERFSEYARSHEHFYICDLDYISSDYGLAAWQDLEAWYMYKLPCALHAIPQLSFNVANIIKSLLGKNKKGYVLDLDNTLWGGVIGDDGVDNIEIGPEEAEGQAYLEFQRYLRQMRGLGAILNVDSKNDETNALAGLARPEGALHADDFIVIKANWEPKDRNFTDIARTLNLLPDSLVFVDDNPAERHIVAAQTGAEAPDIGTPADYIKTLDRLGYFETTTLSADDLARNEMYRENVARAEAQAQYADYHEYLLSLDMVAEIRPFAPLYMARIAQLTNKSNQYNLTTLRCTQAQIEEMAQNPDYITLYGKLADRFGDNGVVSVAIGRVQGDICHIELWLMSCRVLKRDMEYAMMDTFVEACRSRGVRTIRGYYYPTAKNAMVRDFYSLHGFTMESEDESGDTTWTLAVDDYVNKNTVIEVRK